jgi:hypothetical protein
VESGDVKKAVTPSDDEVLEYWRRYRHIQLDRELVFRVLKWRGIPVTALIRRRVELCACQELLGVWMHRALHATHEDEVFTGE